jgi:hypothetical protein
MGTVKLNDRTREPLGPDRIVQHHRLALVGSSKVELSPGRFGTGPAAFTPAEMHHNFAIWPVKNHADRRPRLHLYYCVRCKQAFSVDDWSGRSTPVDSQGTPLQGREAIKRLGTFSCGPCPALSRLTRPRPTSTLIPIHTARGRLTELSSAGWRVWRAVVAYWHRLAQMDRPCVNLRNNRR